MQQKSFKSGLFKGFIVLCLRVWQAVVPTVWGLEQATDTGWVCWFPPPAEQKTCIYFSFTCSQLKEEVTDEEGGDSLKQEMTSIPSATQLTTMIKNGKREIGKRQRDPNMFEWCLKPNLFDM